MTEGRRAEGRILGLRACQNSRQGTPSEARLGKADRRSGESREGKHLLLLGY